ncbi:MAG TPA: L-lactate permease [Terriglobia bacterium]|nr:L-lactate permease [Terriglobia bacterium]
MFTQVLDPLNSLGLTALAALVPVVLLLVLLAIYRVTAWVATLIGAMVTLALAVLVWHVPALSAIKACVYGSATGVWAVDWITFWGVIIFNTLTFTGVFGDFQKWLSSNATADVRVQTMLLAWAFGALLEGLVGFGYPWAVVAPMLIALGIRDLDAIRVAAIANNAPVSFGGLGVPIVALAAVTGMPLMALSASIGKIVALLALAPPWVLIYLVAGRRGLRGAWPLAAVGSLAYIAGQYPVSQFLGPFLPDISGAAVCFIALLLLLRFWKPAETLGYGGVPVEEVQSSGGHGLSRRRVLAAWAPFILLVIVVVLWTGPWSSLPAITLKSFKVEAVSSLSHKTIDASFAFKPFIGGTSIMAAWILIVLMLRPGGHTLKTVFRRTFKQMWGALLVGVFIFALAYIFNYSGMAASLAYAFSRLGVWFIVVAPILGWIGVALSGSNTSTNAMFGAFQAMSGSLLGFPPLLAPSLNSVGAEVGKPIAPQTASVGVATTGYVRNEGEVIRHNMGWTLVLVGVLICIGLFYYFVLPGTMMH